VTIINYFKKIKSKSQLSKYIKPPKYPHKNIDDDDNLIIGYIQFDNEIFTVISINKKDKWAYPIFNITEHNLKHGDLVSFKIVKQKIKNLKEYYANIVQIIRSNVHQLQSLSTIALEQFNIPYHFSQETLLDIKKITEISPKNSVIKRDDLTHLPFITIDPHDAKDHDDAVYAYVNEKTGGAVIYVAIADVSAYVTFDSSIDKDAQIRGNSIYLPDKVIPMLPEILSNNLCSLKAGKIKPVLVVKIDINSEGQKINHQFMRAFINCKANLSYEAVYDASQDVRNPLYCAYQEAIIQPLLKTYALLEIAQKKRKPLDLDLPEYKIILNEAFEPINIEKKERLFTHKLIEEFMVLANVCAAVTLSEAEFSVVHRSHDVPTIEKLLTLKEILHDINISIKKSKTIKPEFFNNLLKASEHTELHDIISKMVLRTQSQAVYQTNSKGHFGLNLKHYVHFTSPIRRYADLLIHRCLIRHLDLGNDGIKSQEMEQLTSICQHISSTERRAMKAEMETKDRFLAEFLKNKIAHNFLARISGLTNAGIFVRLPEYGAEGFIPIEYLKKFSHKRCYFQTNQTRHILSDKYSGQYYQMGQKIHVSLLKVNLLTGEVLFTITDKNDLNNPY
jgi:ribonuclease R